MTNELFEAQGLRGQNSDLSSNHTGNNVSSQHGKTGSAVSAEGSLLTLSTEGGVNVVNKTVAHGKATEASFAQRAAYQAGNVLNELTAAAWYSYMLIYFQNVIGLSPMSAGLLFLISQAVQAVITLVVAFRFDENIWRRFAVYGTSKARHILGSAGILLSWPLIFAPCLFESTGEPEIGTVVYYLIPVFVFTASWPLVEVSSTCLVADHTTRSADKQFIGYHLSRSATRHSCTMCLYATVWFLLKSSSSTGVNIRTQEQFVRLSLFIVPTGFVFVFIYHLALGDSKPSVTSSGMGKRVLEEYRGHIADVPLYTIRLPEHKPTFLKIWKDWLKHPQFCKVGAVYLCSQNLLYISHVYFPLYLTETLRFSKESIASYPLIVVVIGYMTNMARDYATTRLGTKLSLMIASGLALGASAWFYYLEVSQRFLTYAAVILFSCGSSFITYIASVLLAELTLMEKQTGENAVGALAFLDRALLGVVVLFLQLCYPGTLSPYRSLPETFPAGNYLRGVFSLVPGINALVLLVMAIFFVHQQYPGEEKSGKVLEEATLDRGDGPMMRPEGRDKFQGSESTTTHSGDTKATQRTFLESSCELRQESSGLLRFAPYPSENTKTTDQRQLSSAQLSVEKMSNASFSALPTIPGEERVCPNDTMNSEDLTSQASSTVSTCTTTDEIRKTVMSRSSGSSAALHGFYEFPRPVTQCLCASLEDTPDDSRSGTVRNDVNGAVVHIVTLDINKLRNMSVIRAEP